MTDFVIPEEAVEDVAKAIYEAPHDGLSRKGYDAAPRDIQDLYRAEAKLALAAALPHLRAHQPERQSVRANERDYEVNGYHQTGPDEAHHRSQCDTTVCGWPPVKWVDLFGMDPDYGDTSDEAETKALAETAIKLGYELGRKETAEALGRLENEFRVLSDPSCAHKTGATAWREAYLHAHECVLQEQQAMDGKDLMGNPLPTREIGGTS